MPGDVGYRASATALSREVLTATLGVEKEDLPAFPFTPNDPLLVKKVNPVDPVWMA
jgi:oxalate decarboxylase